MYKLPVTVFVNNKEYKIRENGDYRFILDLIQIYNDIELPDDEKYLTLLLLFYDIFNEIEDIVYEFNTVELMQEALNQIMLFIACGGGDNYGYQASYPLIDWETDEQLIVAGINPLLGNGSDVRFIDYMHWWTFISYYMGIGEGGLSTVVSIRDKIVRGKKLEKHEKEFKQHNPQYFRWREKHKTLEEKQLENDIYALWGKPNVEG